MKTKLGLSIAQAMFWIGLIYGLCHLGGCAKVDVVTPEVQIHTFTFLKDVRFDPNGVCSTTSSSAENILTGLCGLVVGLWL